MRTFPKRLLGLVIGLVAAASSLQAAFAVDFYVAPIGNDLNPGSQSKPFASFHRAQEAVRAARKADPDASITVNFNFGTYFLTSPIEFTPEDSGVSAERPVTYQAQPGADAIISGGLRIRGWQPDPQHDGIWKAHVAPPAGFSGQSWRFDQLWVNGQPAIRARAPDSWNFAVVDSVVEKVDASDPNLCEHTFGVPPRSLEKLRGLSQDELSDVQVVVLHKWDSTREALLAASPAEGTFTTRGSKMQPWNKMEKGSLFYLENCLAALDAPGEWFLDRQGWLRYWPRPGENMAQAEVIAPVAGLLLSVEGSEDNPVQHLRFAGLKFRYAGLEIPRQGLPPAQAAMNVAATTVQLDNARDIEFTHSAIEHIGSTAIWFRHNCQDCRLEQVRLFDLGVGGVRIGETSVEPQNVRTARISVDNCIIQSGGRIRPDATAVWIGQSGDNLIRHCDIGDFFYTGISAGWRWGYGESVAHRNRFEYNHIHHLGYRILSDMGGIYTLGGAEGTVVRNNVIHDVYSASYGGWGLYADEGTSGILYENNLVYDVMDGCIHQHYGETNIFRNNIFAFSDNGMIAFTRAEPHLSFTFEHNLVYQDKGPTLGYGGWKNGGKVLLRDNLYWRTDGQPEDFAGQTWEQWRALGNDSNSMIADPLFLNPAQRDFRLRSDSPAPSIDFKPFNPADAGVTGEPSWKMLATNRTFPTPFVLRQSP